MHTNKWFAELHLQLPNFYINLQPFGIKVISLYFLFLHWLWAVTHFRVVLYVIWCPYNITHISVIVRAVDQLWIFYIIFINVQNWLHKYHDNIIYNYSRKLSSMCIYVDHLKIGGRKGSPWQRWEDRKTKLWKTNSSYYVSYLFLYHNFLCIKLLFKTHKEFTWEWCLEPWSWWMMGFARHIWAFPTARERNGLLARWNNINI